MIDRKTFFVRAFGGAIAGLIGAAGLGRIEETREEAFGGEEVSFDVDFSKPEEEFAVGHPIFYSNGTLTYGTSNSSDLIGYVSDTISNPADGTIDVVFTSAGVTWS